MPETAETLPDGRVALRFERHLRHSREKVWRAITEPDQLRAWFVEIIDYDRSRLDFAPGAPLTFAAAGFPDGRGEVTGYDPPALLEYTWAGEILRFELTAEGETCRLAFTNIVDGPETASALREGWQTGLDRLAATLGDADARR
ncbi:SRPBCC domain-containing protein [Actinophytocola sp.]|uniref:SRPBCC domain-containing protein n=1 Tax=Actinophytocola sp. TaxID=1872138 RepID=UPI0025BEC5D0|nr:SRPBCC domain-containing protein [Actinophytocola sp.]